MPWVDCKRRNYWLTLRLISEAKLSRSLIMIIIFSIGLLHLNASEDIRLIHLRSLESWSHYFMSLKTSNIIWKLLTYSVGVGGRRNSIFSGVGRLRRCDFLIIISYRDIRIVGIICVWRFFSAISRRNFFGIVEFF